VRAIPVRSSDSISQMIRREKRLNWYILERYLSPRT
jgi:hypothetical protein